MRVKELLSAYTKQTINDNSFNKSSELLCDKWYQNAERNPDKDAIVHWVAGEEPFRWSFKNLLMQAETFAISMKGIGIRKDDVCAIIMRHNTYFYPIYIAVSLLGAVPAVLAYPNSRLHPDKFRHGLEGMSKRSGIDYILTENSLEEVIKPLVEKKDNTIKGLIYPLDWDTNTIYEDKKVHELHEQRKNIKPDFPALLQHSSGTTGLQKPIVLSHQAILEHIENYSNAIELSVYDKIVSWLPLYHDMGLIAAFHFPLAFRITTVLLDTFEWVMVPSLLCEAISKEKGTIFWQPNFAFNLMADKIRDDDLEDISLESLRMIINCSEPIRYESYKKFYMKFSKYGLKPSVLSSCYAMAETTFAVTQSQPGLDPTILKVSNQDLSKGKVTIEDDNLNARICVSSGKVIIGCNIRIVDDERKDLLDGLVGELAISSVSMFDEYRNYPEKTIKVLENRWYYSGDYGFHYNGEYFIIGRKKDIIITGGNNIYPEDIEDLVGEVDGIIPGRVVAFGEYNEDIGSEQISIAVETKINNENEREKLKLEIIKAAMKIDISIKKIYFVPPRWLIKCSAGKPSRKANKERILTTAEN